MTVTKGWATKLALVWTVLGVLSALFTAWKDSNPFGASPETMLKASAMVVLVMGFGRVLQAINGERPVRWDLTSSITFAATVASALAGFFSQYVTEGVALGISASHWTWLSAAFASAFTIFRQMQAAFGGSTNALPLDVIVESDA